ncbi:MAG: hypothetical protein LUO79_03255 [Methanomassiliicoccales archaeon]|nr:hypothetical protein [Methanomassiliicoccales archaeon]
MSWFKYAGKEVALPWKQWRAGRKDPDDLEALSALGVRALKEATGSEGLQADVHQVEAIAHLLHHAFKGKGPIWIKGMAASFEGREPPNEPRLWDPPSLALEAHQRLLRRNRIEPLSAQALLLGDELDTRIRPGLLRTSWILSTACGGDASYHDAMLDPALQPRSFSFAVQGLRSNLAVPGPRCLDPEERRSMIALVDETNGFRSGHFAPDDVIWCLRSGSFRYSEGWLELSRNTEWVLVSPGELKRKLTRALRMSGVLEAQKVMLLAHVAHAVGGLRPKGISVQSMGCDKKGSRSPSSTHV